VATLAAFDATADLIHSYQHEKYGIYFWHIPCNGITIKGPDAPDGLKEKR